MRHTKDAVSWMELDKLGESLGDNANFDDFLDQIIETRLPQFASDHRNKYGENPDISIITGWVDKDNESHLVEIYDDGDYDYKDNFAAIGSGSIFGEILLRKLHDCNMSISTAQRLIGYIIWEI
ncbi:MAG TPA: hypothetical protein G4O16_10135 [Dehalococcoidia bacterium]|nr:hypothetical protein [Dehalococcoidia bacterium]